MLLSDGFSESSCFLSVPFGSDLLADSSDLPGCVWWLLRRDDIELGVLMELISLTSDTSDRVGDGQNDWTVERLSRLVWSSSRFCRRCSRGGSDGGASICRFRCSCRTRLRLSRRCSRCSSLARRSTSRNAFRVAFVSSFRARFSAQLRWCCCGDSQRPQPPRP